MRENKEGGWERSTCTWGWWNKILNVDCAWHNNTEHELITSYWDFCLVHVSVAVHLWPTVC